MVNDQESQTLIPVKQDEIPFYGQQLIAARLEDDRIIVIIRWMCESLKLDPTAQVRRIKRTKAIADELVTVQVQTPGGTQVMPALTLRALPFWLAGIDSSRLDPSVEPMILAYQREVVEVLYRYYAEQKLEPAAPATLVPAEPIVQPVVPAQDASNDAWLAYHEQMVIWLRWRQDLEHWQGTVETRLEHLEEVTRLVPEILERLGPHTLSQEHLRTIQSYVNQVNRLTGQTHAAIYDALREHFRVSSYKELPESRWQDIVAWFNARISRGQQGQQGQLF